MIGVGIDHGASALAAVTLRTRWDSLGAPITRRHQLLRNDITVLALALVRHDLHGEWQDTLDKTR